MINCSLFINSHQALGGQSGNICHSVMLLILICIGLIIMIDQLSVLSSLIVAQMAISRLELRTACHTFPELADGVSYFHMQSIKVDLPPHPQKQKRLFFRCLTGRLGSRHVAALLTLSTRCHKRDNENASLKGFREMNRLQIPHASTHRAVRKAKISP